MEKVSVNCIKFLFVLILFSQFTYSQLANFNLSVIKTNETCTGNGSLTFNITNATVGSNFIYSIYLLPNTTSPIALLNGTSITGLSAGNYRVVALQSFNGNSNSQQQDIQILDLRAPLVYTISSDNVTCFTLANITVSVTQGNPLSYEIVSGPEIRSSQVSNVFLDLPIGEFTIKVTDVCGDAVVQTHTVVLTTIETLNVALVTQDMPGGIYDCILENCTTRTVSMEITSDENTILNYPLNIEVIVYPPNGANLITINQILLTGNSLSQIVNVTVPYYINYDITFDVNVTSFCGELAEVSGNQTYFVSKILMSRQGPAECVKKIRLFEPCNLLPPFMVSFITTPTGFDSANFNVNNLGPFTSFPINYNSNNSNEIPNGDYIIRVTDTCGNIAQGLLEVEESFTDFLLQPIPCESNLYLTAPEIGVPIQSIFIVNAPSELGLTLPFNASSSIVNGHYSTTLLPGSYLFTGVNICGDLFSIEINIPIKELELDFDVDNLTGCSGNYGSIRIDANNVITSVIVTNAPIGFPYILPYNASAFIQFGGINFINIPAGNYTFIVTDICGNVKTESTIVPTIISQAQLYLYEKKGCGLYNDSIAFISPNGSLTQVIITAAPSNFLFPLPYDASFNIANGIFCMNSLPVGNYTFYSKDECNVERNENKTLSGFVATNLIEIQPNCGSFNISLFYPNNNTEGQTFWLQKFDVLNNQWVHPITEIPFVAGQILNDTNSYQLNNLSVNYNISTIGVFRILVDYKIFDNGIYQLISCVETIKNFEFTGTLSLDSQYSLLCNSGQTDVVLIVTGVAPYTFEITTQNGLPFYVNNGISNVFTGLQSGIYNFQVVDACGNVLNKLIDLNTLIEPQITPDNLCEGQIGKLSLPNIPLLNYQWWKNNDTSTILSTTSSLIFNPVTSTTLGTYYVRIYSTSPLSCIDKIISFVINPIVNPNAGQDGILNICSSTGIINLSTLINGTFDSNGIWTEITNSGNLVGSNWNSSSSSFGQYIFKYRVTGNCNSIDESIVTINYSNAPPTPTITGVLELCEGETLTLNSNSVANVSYLWTEPNNFSSSNQNVILNAVSEINAGLYTVKVVLNGCEATSNVNVVVNKRPSFTLKAGCEGSNYTIAIIPNEQSFNLSEVSYLWSGPNGFSSTLNPIIITNQTIGNYSVQVFNSNQCVKNEEITILNTFCDFPNSITPNNDGTNDSFDLTGLEVENFKIYSRWGRLLYEKNNYLNSWHGQNTNNNDLPDSTYFYSILLKSGEEKNGWVLLTR